MSTQNPKVSRRTLFAGAGTVGAVAVSYQLAAPSSKFSTSSHQKSQA
jgi:hypothetical protein